MEKPKIRFGQFNDKWKKNKLDTVVDFFDNQRIPIDSGERKSGPYPYYGASGIIDFVDGYIFNGEYVLLAEDGANIILRSSPIAYLSKGKFWLNNHAHIMKMKTGSNEFLIQLLEKQSYEKYNTGTAQPKLNGEVVKKISLHFPSDEEQSAIGTFFRTLDDLLASYKDNLANYQSLKATMLSKMFPKAGQTIPEIRLGGFEGEWEKLKLRDVVHTNPKSELPENFKYIDLESVVGTRINKIREERKESAPSRAQRLAKKGDVFYQTVRPYQKNNYLFKLDEIDYVFSTGYAQLRPIFKRCDSDFLLILLQNNRFLSKVLDRCTGTSYPAINVNDLIEILIAIPSYEEQQAIGTYFSNLDNIINSNQEKISQLETLKKKLLQDMFI